MPTSVDTVLFDLDGTLVEYRRSTPEVLRAAFDRAGYAPFFEAADYFARFGEFAETAPTIEVLRSSCFEAIAVDAGWSADDGRAVANAYTDERDQSNVELLPGALDAIETLAADHRLGLITNGTRAMQETKLSAVGLDDVFETTIFAGNGIPPKPDPEPFQRGLADLDVRAEQAVYVGNSVSADVAGALAAGLRSVWLREDGIDPDPEPHYVVDSLGDLLDRPWRANP